MTSELSIQQKTSAVPLPRLPVDYFNFPDFRSVAAGLGCPASPAHSMVRCLREAELGELLNVSQTLQSRYVQLFLPQRKQIST